MTKKKKRGEYTVYDSYQDVVNVSMFGKFVRGNRTYRT